MIRHVFNSFSFLVLFFIFVFSFSCQFQTVQIFKELDGSNKVFKVLPIPWAFSCEFPLDQEENVRKAFNYWQKELGNEKQLFAENSKCGITDFFVAGKSGGIGIIHSNDQEFVILKGKKIFLWGVAPTMSENNKVHAGLVLLYPVWLMEEDDGTKESIVRHEIGHVLGFKHTDVEKCIMYDSIEPNSKLKNACQQEIDLLREMYLKGE